MKKILSLSLLFALALLATAQIEWRTIEKQEAQAVFVELPAKVDSVVIVTENEILRGTKTVQRWKCIDDGTEFFGLPVFRVSGKEVIPIAYRPDETLISVISSGSNWVLDNNQILPSRYYDFPK